MTKKLLQLIPLMQSAALLDDSVEFSKKKKKTSKDFIKKGVKDIVGVSLIAETSKFLN